MNTWWKRLAIISMFAAGAAFAQTGGSTSGGTSGTTGSTPPSTSGSGSGSSMGTGSSGGTSSGSMGSDTGYGGGGDAGTKSKDTRELGQRRIRLELDRLVRHERDRQVVLRRSSRGCGRARS